MKKMRCAVAIIMVLTFAATLFLMESEAIDAQECRLVRIYSAGQNPGASGRLEPDVLSVDKGGCVVWVNWGQDRVLVNFRDGKKCQAVTEAPTGFKLDANTDCYVTDFVPFGGTSSLKFSEPGTYHYEVTWEKQKGKVQKGKVMVRGPKKKAE
jgi:hypothetical protein